MHKRLCACGCGDRVTRKVEGQHINVLTPAVLASQVLDQNPRLHRKKKSQSIGFPQPLRQRLAMDKISEIDNMDHAGPSHLTNHTDPVSLHSSKMMGENLDGPLNEHRSGPSARYVKQSKFFETISQLHQHFHIDHAGLSGHTYHPVSLHSPKMMGENLDGQLNEHRHARYVKQSKFFETILVNLSIFILMLQDHLAIPMMIIQDHLALPMMIMMPSHLIPLTKMLIWIIQNHQPLPTMMLSWQTILIMNSMASPTYVVLVGLQSVLKP